MATAYLDQRDLLKALGKLKGLVTTGKMRALSMVLIEPTASGVTVTGTTLDARLTIDVKGHLDTPMLVGPIRWLDTLVRASAGPEVTIVQNLKGAKVIDVGECESMDVGEFPSQAPLGTVKVDIPALTPIIKTAAWSVGVDDRPALRNLLLQSDNGEMVAVSTTGAALTMIKTGVSYNGPNLLVPRASLHILQSLSAIDDVTVYAETEGRTFSMMGDGWQFQFNPGLLVYPDWRKALPKEVGVPSVINRASVLGVVTRASLVLKHGPLKLTWGEQLYLTSDGGFRAALDYQGPAQPYTAVNPAFLAGALRNIKDETVSYWQGSSQGTITIAGKGVTILIMPMHTNRY
jgi:DNA polymerase III sliding clamp (beta) subunit (PCNA family)